MANNPTYSSDAHKREQIKAKASKSVSSMYKYVENDIKLLNGPYEGRLLSEVWQNGSADDRDFLFREFWKKDEIARKLLMENCAK